MSLPSIIRQEVKSMGLAFALDEDHAFPAWFAKVALELDDDDAFDALSLEGPNEKGMDLFWVDQQNKRVFIAQCKYSLKGNHHPKLKDLNDFLACTDWLSSPEDLAREGRLELASAAREFNEALVQDYGIQLWFVYCGPKDENIDKRIRLYNANPDNEQRNRSAIHCHLALIESIYEEWRGEGRRIKSANLRVASQGFEVGGAFGKGVVVSIPASELIRLYEQFGDQLFARNVRGWLGARKGSVNAAIIATLENDKERGNFWAYNNGITLVCDDYKYDPDAATLLCWPKTPSEALGKGGFLSAPVVVVQSIEDRNGDEAPSPRPGWLRHDPLRNPLPNPLVWPCSVVVFDVFLDHPMKLPVPDKQDVIGAFSPHAPEESLADRVGSWSVVGRLQDLKGAYLSICEMVAVFAVPVANQEAWGQAIRRCLPKLLHHPVLGRTVADADVKELPRAKFEAREIAKLLEAVEETYRCQQGAPA